MSIQNHVEKIPDCEKCGGLCCKSFSTFFELREEQLRNYDGFAQDCQKRFSHLKTLSDKVYSFLIDKYEVTVYDDPCEYFINGKCVIHESEDRPNLCKIFPHSNPEYCKLMMKIEAELNKLRSKRKTRMVE